MHMKIITPGNGEVYIEREIKNYTWIIENRIEIKNMDGTTQIIHLGSFMLLIYKG